MMNFFRITKYNPENRDKDGAYTLDEWTSYSDIGKTFSGILLTESDYPETEKRYISFCIDLWKLIGSKPLTVCELEKNKNIIIPETITDEKEMALVIRAILRETCWFKIEGNAFFIHFGYDYYMYIGTAADESVIYNLAQERGLFCEPMKSPYI